MNQQALPAYLTQTIAEIVLNNTHHAWIDTHSRIPTLMLYVATPQPLLDGNGLDERIKRQRKAAIELRDLVLLVPHTMPHLLVKNQHVQGTQGGKGTFVKITPKTARGKQMLGEVIARMQTAKKLVNGPRESLKRVMRDNRNMRVAYRRTKG